MVLAYLNSLAELTTEKTGVRETTDLIDKYGKVIHSVLPEQDLLRLLMQARSNN